jgi:hypothetical protein
MTRQASAVEMSGTKRRRTTKERRYDIDWLRVVATLSIFVFHSAGFFDAEGWELKNAEQSFLVDAVARGGSHVRYLGTPTLGTMDTDGSSTVKQQ